MRRNRKSRQRHLRRRREKIMAGNYDMSVKWLDGKGRADRVEFTTASSAYSEHNEFVSHQGLDSFCDYELGYFKLRAVVPDDVLSDFCSRTDFLAPMRLYRSFKDDDEDTQERAQDTVDRMNRARTSLMLSVDNAGDFHYEFHHFKDCPLVFDTGASYGLTPFRGDFIDYEECNIPVQDITKTNTVVGIGTVMWKHHATNGDVIYLPYLCYHLPSTDIRLLSPQTYHQLHGGESHLVDDGSKIVMDLPRQGPGHPKHCIEIPIEKKITNLPILRDVSCTDKEREDIGPHLRSALPKHRLDFQGSWEEAQTALTRQHLGGDRHWDATHEEFEFEFHQAQGMCCPCVGDDSNKNLTGPQRELLLWHWKLGVSMRRIQQMMVEHEAVDTNNESVIFAQVIKPRFKSTSSCPIPLCTACELGQAKKRNPGVARQQAMEEKAGNLITWDDSSASSDSSDDSSVQPVRRAQESEGDMRADHPSVRNEPSSPVHIEDEEPPELPAAPNIADEPSLAPEGADAPEGAGIDADSVSQPS